MQAVATNAGMGSRPATSQPLTHPEAQQYDDGNNRNDPDPFAALLTGLGIPRLLGSSQVPWYFLRVPTRQDVRELIFFHIFADNGLKIPFSVLRDEQHVASGTRHE